MSTKKIAIIGGGNLGSAIAQGVLKSGFASAADIIITKRNINTLTGLRELGVQAETDNAKAIAAADVIIVALKPYNIKEVLSQVKSAFDPSRHMLISVVTGVSMEEREQIAGPPAHRRAGGGARPVGPGA